MINSYCISYDIYKKMVLIKNTKIIILQNEIILQFINITFNINQF